MSNFPLKVLNRLKLGRSVAVEITSSSTAIRNWLLVQSRGDEPLTFTVWNIRIKSKFADTVYEDGFPYEDEHTSIKSYSAENVEALTQYLSEHSVTPEMLRHPDLIPDFDSIWRGIKEIPYQIDNPKY